ncbi:MAG: YIP1 family protein [Syntrophomonadaceae bacterium]|nr:YIP1 family protein [Syntrophomonadaceae bacterium]
MFIAPASTIRNLGRMGLQNTLIIGGVIALIYGLMGMMIFNTVLSGIAESGLGFFMPDFSEYRGKIFLYMALLVLICMGGLSLGLWLAGKYLFKGKGEYEDFLAIAVVGQIPMLGAIIAGSILSYIWAFLGILVILIGSIITPVVNYAGLHQTSGLDENRSVFAVALAYVVMYIVLAIVFKIVTSM